MRLLLLSLRPRCPRELVSRSAGALRSILLAGALLHGSTYAVGAQPGRGEPAGLVTAARDYFAAASAGPVSFDPRPIRAGSDVVVGVDADDLESDSAALSRRVHALSAAGVKLSDILVDKRCTYSAGVAAPPASASAEAVRQQNECLARGPFATFVLASASLDEGSTRMPPVRAVVYTEAGFQVVDLTFARRADGSWCVEQANQVFSIAS